MVRKATRIARRQPIARLGLLGLFVRCLIGLYLIMGAVLDLTVYRIIAWQPGWLTGLLGLAEYVFLIVLALVLDFDIPVWQATIYYVCIWVLAQCIRIAVLPQFFLTRIEDGGEARPVRWTVTPNYEQLPVYAQAGEQLPERLSGVWRRPSQVGALPSPSQVGRIPPEFLAELEKARQ